MIIKSTRGDINGRYGKEVPSPEEVLETEAKERELVREFAKKFLVPYKHFGHAGMPSHYNRTDGMALRGINQKGFFVTYSIPKHTSSVVASFWTEQEDDYGNRRLVKVHIDLTNLLEAIFKEYIKSKYTPAKQRGE